MADETVPHAAADISATTVPSSRAADASGVPSVAFAPYREVVQPLPDIVTPSGEAVISVPESGHGSLAAMVAATNTSSPLGEQEQCLATAIFYEARSESLEGQLGVARVIINRADSHRFANSLCGVISQPGQFSFVRRGKIPAPRTSRPAWKTAIAVARIALANSWDSSVEGALYFHARRVSPSWRRMRIAAIDNHIFYR